MLLPLLYFEATEAVLLYLVSGVALKVETSRWLSSGKLVAPKEDNIQDGENTKNHVLATYKYAVELFAYLCSQYNLDPLADGVVISHSEGCRRGIASNHGDVEHLWSKFGLTMEQFRKDIKTAMKGGSAADSLTAIMGKAKATADQMKSFYQEKRDGWISLAFTTRM